MKLSLEAVEHIADLARLHLSDDEKARYAGQLSSILEHVERLNALDTTAIPPTSSVLPPRVVLRADKPRPGLSREALLRIAPATQADQFLVPPVLDDSL